MVLNTSEVINCSFIYHISRTAVCRGCEETEVLFNNNKFLYFNFEADGGYDPSPVLLIPLQNALPGSPERFFSEHLREGRAIIENVFGIVKKKWRILNKLRGMHYTPIFAAQITQVCCILHNFVRRNGFVQLLDSIINFYLI